MNTKVYLPMRRRRTEEPPPTLAETEPAARARNPLLDPLAGRKPRRSGERALEFTPIDIQNLRAEFLATQQQFARMIGIRYETLRNWETGRRRPQGPARALLRALAANPYEVARALLVRRRAFKDPPPVDILDE